MNGAIRTKLDTLSRLNLLRLGSWDCHELLILLLIIAYMQLLVINIRMENQLFVRRSSRHSIADMIGLFGSTMNILL